MWTNALAVFVGGGSGALLRWGMSVSTSHWFRAQLVGTELALAATFLVNVLGSFSIGVALGLAWFWHSGPGTTAWSLLVVGLLGGFTTFSAFAGESMQLILAGRLTLAMAHVAAHIFGSLLAAFLGVWLVRLFS